MTQLSRVYKVSDGGMRVQVYEGSIKECEEFCEYYDWKMEDVNGFSWKLEIGN